MYILYIFLALTINLANSAAFWPCSASSLEAERFLDCEGGREGCPVALLLKNDMIRDKKFKGQGFFQI